MPADSLLALPLATDRLQLRAHTPGDAAWLHRVYAQPDVARYLLDDPWDATRAAREAVARELKSDLDGGTNTLALVIERERTPIGDVLMWRTDTHPRIAEVGWVLDPAHAGQGFAREAVAEVLRVAFEHYGLHRVVAQMDARNSASARLATAVGMRREAHLRQDWWNKGEWTDTLVFGMLAEDRDAP